MLDPLSVWLREQRLARGWSVAEMGRQLCKAARTSGDRTVPGAALMGSYVRRWESGKSGVSERYRLHYCAALALAPDLFGPQLPPAGTKVGGSAERALVAASDVQLRANSLRLLDARGGDGDADREQSSAEPADSQHAAASAAFLMAMIAQESLDFGEWADTSNIGDATLEQYADRVCQLADDYQHEAPFPLLAEATRLRDQVFTRVRGHQRPGQARELYAIAAQVCGLLAWMSADLSFYRAADAHAWTGWVCAEHADRDGARSWVRATQSKIAYWDARYIESLQLAEDGLRYPCSDSGHVMLALFRARALARIGRPEDAAQALGSAQDALDQAGGDLVGGLWSVAPARFHSLAGTVQILRQDSRQALAETSLALDQFEAAAPRQHNYGAEVHARIDQAQAHLLLNDLDGAHAALQPVLALSPERRYEPITQHLGQLRQRLAEPAFRGATVARHAQEEIESYCRESAFRELTH